MIAGLLVAICGWVAFSVYSQMAHGANLDSTVKQLTASDAALKAQIADRSLEISQAQSPAWLEEQARKLGYVMPGEKVYVLTSPGASLPSGGGVAAALPSFVPSPSPGASPAPTSAPAGSAPSGSPTPYSFVLPTP